MVKLHVFSSFRKKITKLKPKIEILFFNPSQIVSYIFLCFENFLDPNLLNNTNHVEFTFPLTDADDDDLFIYFKIKFPLNARILL